MATRFDFRVKVDLSKYHQDARRFSWIFVDSSNCWFISDVKQHIINIFGIQEPFHLLLNGDEYLPPSEDVRVLKENEIIVVVPSLGWNDDTTFTPSTCLPVIRYDRDIQNTTEKKLIEGPKEHRQNDKQTDSSVADVSNAEGTLSEVTEIESTSDSNVILDKSTETGKMIDSCDRSMRKRKRTRRKKAKKETEVALSNNIDNERQKNGYKPKILESYLLPIGKHIRFDSPDINDVPAIQNHPENRSAKTPTACASGIAASKQSGSLDLSTLLALRKCSSPLTFVSKKLNPPSENNVVHGETKRIDRPMDVSTSPTAIQAINNHHSNASSDVAKSTEKQSNYSHLHVEKYPTLQSTTELNDTIAFKILRIGKDYSPEISDYIVAKTLAWCPKTLLYTFQILKGHDQIQTPMGKFALPENDTEEEEIDTANFNFSQLIEPRLINRQ